MTALPRLSQLLKYGTLLSLIACTARVVAQDKPYSVIDGRVDARTFQGWQIYQDVNCGLCHGDSAQGPAQPDIRRRLQSISKEQFVESVIQGKGLMPPYIADKRVVDNINELYSYLKARSDGAVGEGKPQKQQKQ
jgi:mono/diheme cytochrome c family protein